MRSFRSCSPLVALRGCPITRSALRSDTVPLLNLFSAESMRSVIVKHGRNEPHIVECANGGGGLAEPFRPLRLGQSSAGQRNRPRRAMPPHPCRHRHTVSITQGMHDGSDLRDVEPSFSEPVPISVALWLLGDHHGATAVIRRCPVLHELADRNDPSTAIVGSHEERQRTGAQQPLGRDDHCGGALNRWRQGVHCHAAIVIGAA